MEVGYSRYRLTLRNTYFRLYVKLIRCDDVRNTLFTYKVMCHHKDDTAAYFVFKKEEKIYLSKSLSMMYVENIT